MAYLLDVSQWESGIYQLEEDDPVQGGPGAIDNVQSQQLANRTRYLKDLFEAINFASFQTSDPTLTAIAALVTAADKLIYATGQDTFALTTLSVFARTLIDDVDASTARTTLGAAPLASPTFTGTPAAPTAAPGTNTTQVSTTAFVQAALAALVASSPAALDTLNELASALGNDANFATTITNALALKAPLNSPALVTPQLGTPASGNLVNCNLAGVSIGYRNIPQNAQSTNYTAVLADGGSHLLHPTGDAAARTFTIPANASVAYPLGTAITFANGNAVPDLIISINADVMRMAKTGLTGSRTLAANGMATALKITATEWLISGAGLS